MCGIVAYIGPRQAAPLLIQGLHRLEYRGYDSAGLATVEQGKVRITKTAGRVAALENLLTGSTLSATAGIGHTRWATHGAPTTINAHPHTDNFESIAVVHNGIIENHEALRERLHDCGAIFQSQTDTEVLPHLLHQAEGDMEERLRDIARQIHGSYALAVVTADAPEAIYALRHGSPLIIGLGEGEQFLASDVTALMPHTHRMIYLPEDHVACIRPDGVSIYDSQGAVVQVGETSVDFDWAAADKSPFPHYMLKEIHEQPRVLRRLLQHYLQDNAITMNPDLLPDLTSIHRVILVACGTACHAAMVGRVYIEQWARIGAEAEVASEFRYGDRLLDKHTLVIVISQSGETADTLEAARLARRAGAPVLGIVNVPESSIAREADAVLFTYAGPEVGVASTKVYTAQLAVLALFALHLAAQRKTLSTEESARWTSAIKDIPAAMEQMLALTDQVNLVASLPQYARANNAMFIGRGVNYASALEGALKLKEISYIHVEGYAAGEMKHGPIALVTHDLPVVAIAVPGPVYEKTLSNIEELRARGARVIAVAAEDDDRISRHADHVLWVPQTEELLSPLLVAVALQLFAYYAAVALGRDVDRPRNLAKSVTVE